jgi:cytidine deaminase
MTRNTTPILLRMLKKANLVMKNAYVPTCNFPVGACVRTRDNKLFVGCNYENASYSLSLCAEAVVIGAMVSAGYTLIEDIVIVAEKKAICPPCGACRQRIIEFSSSKTKVHLGSKNNIHKTLTIDELLPISFTLKS